MQVCVSAGESSMAVRNALELLKSGDETQKQRIIWQCSPCNWFAYSIYLCECVRYKHMETT